jgi:hypothetical protein
MIVISPLPRTALLGLTYTLFDISFLRKGPEDLPHSWIVLYWCVALWSAGLLCVTVLLQNFTSQDSVISIVSWLLSLVCYGAVLAFMGQQNRMLQTLSAIIGTGAVITFGMLAALVLLTPFLGGRIASFAAIAVLIWSIPVKGHIIARAIDRSMYTGFLIALGVFVLQFALSQILTPES